MSQLLGVIPKNELEEIRVQVREFRGSVYLVVRVYWRIEPDEQEWKPGKKGVTLKPDQVGELIAALEKVGNPASEDRPS